MTYRDSRLAREARAVGLTEEVQSLRRQQQETSRTSEIASEVSARAPKRRGLFRTTSAMAHIMFWGGGLFLSLSMNFEPLSLLFFAPAIYWTRIEKTKSIWHASLTALGFAVLVILISLASSR